MALAEEAAAHLFCLFLSSDAASSLFCQGGGRVEEWGTDG